MKSLWETLTAIWRKPSAQSAETTVPWDPAPRKLRRARDIRPSDENSVEAPSVSVEGVYVRVSAVSEGS